MLHGLSCERLEDENAEVNAEGGGLACAASEGRFVWHFVLSIHGN